MLPNACPLEQFAVDTRIRSQYQHWILRSLSWCIH